MQKGFSILTAIFFLVIISTLSFLGISLSSMALKQSSEIYLYEQAELLAKGATEYAIVKLIKELPCGVPGKSACATPAQSSDCTNFPTTLTGNFPNNTTPLLKYSINIRYFDTANPSLGCPAMNTTIISTPSSRGTIMLDVVVEMATSQLQRQNPIRFYRRTLQKL